MHGFMLLFILVTDELCVDNISMNLFYHREILEGCQWSGRRIAEPKSSTNTTKFMRLSDQVRIHVRNAEVPLVHFLCVVNIFTSPPFKGVLLKSSWVGTS